MDLQRTILWWVQCKWLKNIWTAFFEDFLGSLAVCLCAGWFITKAQLGAWFMQRQRIPTPQCFSFVSMKVSKINNLECPPGNPTILCITMGRGQAHVSSQGIHSRAGTSWDACGSHWSGTFEDLALAPDPSFLSMQVLGVSSDGSETGLLLPTWET